MENPDLKITIEVKAKDGGKGNAIQTVVSGDTQYALSALECAMANTINMVKGSDTSALDAVFCTAMRILQYMQES